MSPAAIAAIAAGVLVLLIAGLYNSLVRARRMVDESWSGVDVQLERRHDLVPNLVNVVRGYAAHEAETFQAVTNARATALAVDGPQALGAAENLLTATLGRLHLVAEQYPDLRASENFLQLQAELSNTEDQIAAARRIYNSNVEHFNTKVQSFPALLLAGPFGFAPREFFALEDETDRAPVAVSL